MKTNKKFKVINIITALSLLAVCGAVASLDVNEAKAETPTAATEGLSVSGAYVQVEEGKGYSIMFNAEITSSFHSTVGDSVKYGMIVGPQERLADVMTADDLDSLSVVADGEGDYYKIGYLGGSEADDVQQRVNFNSADTFNYRAGIVYNEATLIDYIEALAEAETDAEKQAKYEAMLENDGAGVVRSYADIMLTAIPYYEVDGVMTLNGYDACTRSIQHIINETYVRTKEANAEDTTWDNAETRYVGEVKKDTKDAVLAQNVRNYSSITNNQLCTQNANGTFNTTTVGSSILPDASLVNSFVIGGQEIEGEHNNMLTFTDDQLAQLNLQIGKTYGFSVFTDDGVYNTTFVYATDLFNHSSPFTVANNATGAAGCTLYNYTGYGVLGVDLSKAFACGTAKPLDTAGFNGFSGTLDGRGHTITGAAGIGGLLGYINGGTVKNLHLKCTGFGNTPMNTSYSTILATDANDATLENIYVEFPETVTAKTGNLASTDGSHSMAKFVRTIKGKSKLSNIIVKNDLMKNAADVSEVATADLKAEQQGTFVNYFTAFDFSYIDTTVTFDNVYSVGSSPLALGIETTAVRTYKDETGNSNMSANFTFPFQETTFGIDFDGNGSQDGSYRASFKEAITVRVSALPEELEGAELLDGYYNVTDIEGLENYVSLVDNMYFLCTGILRKPIHVGDYWEDTSVLSMPVSAWVRFVVVDDGIAEYSATNFVAAVKNGTVGSSFGGYWTVDAVNGTITM